MIPRHETMNEERLPATWELLLYNIALKQNDMLAQTTHIFLSRIESDPAYQEMVKRGFLTYKVFSHGGAPVAKLHVTPKGLHYCYLHSDEIEPRRHYDIRGGSRKPRSLEEPKQEVGISVEEDGCRWSYTVIDDSSVQIVGVSGVSGVLHVPAELDGRTVVALAANALSRNEDIREIICSDSIRTIGDGAFRCDSNLKRLVLPANTASFEANWTSQCPKLEEVVLPGLLERIERGVLANGELARLVVGRRVREIEPGAFQGSQLAEVLVDKANPYITTDGVAIYSKDRETMIALAVPVHSLAIARECTRIARKCCHGFSTLETVELPESLVEIGPFAFSGTGLKRFDAPTSLRTIGEKAFLGCSALRIVSLNQGLQTIGNSAFQGSGISALTIPASIERIGSSITKDTDVIHSGPRRSFAIDGTGKRQFLDDAGGLYRHDEDGMHLAQIVDDGIERYTVCDGTVAIDPYAFANCGRISSVVLPDSVRSIGQSAFRGCANLRRISLPDAIETIGDEAFFDTSLEIFRVPASLGELGERALVTRGARYGNRALTLTHIEVAPGNETFYIACGMLCRKTEKGASVVMFTNSESHVEFPKEITRIEDYAFNGARGIEYLSLDPRLSTIGISGLSTQCWIKHIHVELSEPLEGRCSFDFFFPNTPAGIRGISLGLGGVNGVDVPGIFRQLDASLLTAHSYVASHDSEHTSAYEQARLVLERLDDPVLLSAGNRNAMEQLLREHVEDICVDAALHDDRRVFESLLNRGFVNADNLDAVIERVTALRDAATSAYLLEAKRQRFSASPFDFDL